MPIKRRRGYAQYTSAGAFEQQRISQLIADVSSGSDIIIPSGYGDGPYTSIPGNGGVTSGISLDTALFQGNGGSLVDSPSTTAFTFTTVESKSFVTNNTTHLTLQNGLYAFSWRLSPVYRPSSTAVTYAVSRAGSLTAGNDTMYSQLYWASGATTAIQLSFLSFMIARTPWTLGGNNFYLDAYKVATGTVMAIAGYLSVQRIGV